MFKEIKLKWGKQAAAEKTTTREHPGDEISHASDTESRCTRQVHY